MHKRIGILGGMSPESTVAYYQYITRSYVQKFGDHDYPEILIFSVSFEPYITWPKAGQWDLVAKGLSEAAKTLETAGAELILIATNTMHMVFDEVQASVSVPMINLIDVVGQVIKDKGLNTVGLLGTKFTMELPFYGERLEEHGITVIVPDDDEREYVNKVIYEELVEGEISSQSRQGFKRIINNLSQNGAEGVILGCTEIPLLITQGDVDLPLFDTTTIHAKAALDAALN